MSRFPEVDAVLADTDYTARVQVDGGMYVVTVSRPIPEEARSPAALYYEDTIEIIGERTLPLNATSQRLASLIEDIIGTDMPSLTGTYRAEKENS